MHPIEPEIISLQEDEIGTCMVAAVAGGNCLDEIKYLGEHEISSSPYSPGWGKSGAIFDIQEVISSINIDLSKRCHGNNDPRVTIKDVEILHGASGISGKSGWRRAGIGARAVVNVEQSNVREGEVVINLPIRCGLACGNTWGDPTRSSCVLENYSRQLHWVIAEIAYLAAFEEDDEKLYRNTDSLYTNLFCRSTPPYMSRQSAWDPLRGVGLPRIYLDELEERREELTEERIHLEAILNCANEQ
jgi:hypothetical protein